MNANSMAHLFNRDIKNILHNFMLHEIITRHDRDSPWIDISIRSLIQDKNEAYKLFKISNNNSQCFENFQSLQNLLGVSTEVSKQRYYSRLSKKINGSIHNSQNVLAIESSFHNNKKILYFINFLR